MKTYYKTILKNSGQAVMESILLISIFFGILSLVVRIFKDKKIIQDLVATPWKQIDSVIKYGDIKKNPIHPNSIDRHQSLKPQ